MHDGRTPSDHWKSGEKMQLLSSCRMGQYWRVVTFLYVVAYVLQGGKPFLSKIAIVNFLFFPGSRILLPSERAEGRPKFRIFQGFRCGILIPRFSYFHCFSDCLKLRTTNPNLTPRYSKEFKFAKFSIYALVVCSYPTLGVVQVIIGEK